MDYKILKIAGVTHNQKRMRKCRIGEKIQLKREHGNKHDKYAVEILSRYGPLGYISIDKSEYYAKALDHGVKYDATLNEIGEFENDEGELIAFGTIKVYQKKSKPLLIRIIYGVVKVILFIFLISIVMAVYEILNR